MSTTKVTDALRNVTSIDAAKLTGAVDIARLPSTVRNSNVTQTSPEIYGFNVNAAGSLIVTTTNSGADNISDIEYASFDDVVIGVSGITWSISGTNLIATI